MIAFPQVPCVFIIDIYMYMHMNVSLSKFRDSGGFSQLSAWLLVTCLEPGTTI